MNVRAGKVIRAKVPLVLDFLYLAAACALFLALFHDAASPAPFSYDEADYMMGAQLGVAANYLDTNAMSLPEFVDTGMKAQHKELSRKGLSELIRSRRDPVFYRHYHGPLNAYWLSITGAIVGNIESSMRLASMLFHILTFITIYCGVLWVFGPQFRIAAAVASTCYLFCVNNIFATATLSSHAPFVWLSIATLFAIAKFATDPERKRFYWALALCAVSLCAIEYAVLLFFVLGVTLLLVRKQFFCEWTKQDYLRFCGVTLLLVVGLIFILWPSSILKFTIVQGFAYIVFLAANRSGSFGALSPLDVWKARFEQFPMDMAALSICIIAAAFLVWRSPRRNRLLPFLLYGSLLTLTTLKNTSEGSRYISSMFAPFYVCGAVLLAERAMRIPMRLQAAAAAVLFGAMFFVAHGETAARTVSNQSDETNIVLDWMSVHPSARVLIPALYLPTLQYYFPHAVIQSYPPETGTDAIMASAQSYDGACLYVTGSEQLPLTDLSSDGKAAAKRLACYSKH
ncbi:MAG: glycosyltransferase family 39 protein [Bryobacteraceae bacterium]|jgi:Dolichyl-phosphate-mannose-protein mannosyltransferase